MILFVQYVREEWKRKLYPGQGTIPSPRGGTDQHCGNDKYFKKKENK